MPWNTDLAVKQVRAGESPRLDAFLQDATRFALYNRSVIEVAPLQLYYSALLFAPKFSMVRGYISDEISSLISRLPETPDHWHTLQQTLEGHSGPVTAVTFSTDGQIVASGSTDRSVKLWNAATGALQQTMNSHTGQRISGLVFSPDDRLIASSARAVKVWDVATGALQWTLTDDSEFPDCVCFSPDGSFLASGCRDLTVKLWDVATGALQRTFQLPEFGYNRIFRSINAVAFSPDGQQIVTSNFDSGGKNAVKIWDVSTGDLQRSINDPSKTNRGLFQNVVLALSPHCDLVVSRPYISDKTVNLWSMATGNLLHRLMGHSHRVGSVAVSSNGKRVVSGSDDQTVKVWDVATGALVCTFRGHSAPVRGVAFSPDGKLVASSSEDNTIKLWDASKQAHGQMLEEEWNQIQSLAISPDGATVVSGSNDGVARLWDTRTGALRHELKGHSKWVYAVTFSHDGKSVASGSNDGCVRIWDATLGTLQQTLKVLDPYSSSEKLGRAAISFSPDNRLIAFGMMDVTVWDVATGAIHNIFHNLHGGAAGWVNSLAFSADSKRLLSGMGRFDVKIKLWSVTSSAMLGHGRPGRWYRKSRPNNKHNGSTKNEHGNESNHDNEMDGESDSEPGWDKEDPNELDDITALAFSPKSDLVACATRFRTTTIKVWDAKTGATQQDIEIDTAISKISFSDCGPYLETDKGLVRIPGLPDDIPQGQKPACNIFLRKRWIVRDGQDVLWLPPDYRVTYVIIPSRIVVLGHTSGRVTFLEFRRQV